MSSILSIDDNDNQPTQPATRQLGQLGEILAADHLKRAGYRIIVRNFQVPIGRNRQGAAVTGEIDVVAVDGETLCFVEVKTRTSDDFAPIASAVDAAKQRKIIRTGKVFRRLFAVGDCAVRYDVVTVLTPKHKSPDVKLLKGYWTESKFRKRSWSVEFWNDFE